MLDRTRNRPPPDLPDWADQRRLPPQHHAPRWLWPAAILSGASACGVSLWLITPTVRIFQNLLADTVTIFGEPLRIIIFLSLVLGIAGVVLLLFRAIGLVDVFSARSRVIRLQNDQPVDVTTLRSPAWQQLTDSALLAHYMERTAWANNSGQRNWQTVAPHITYQTRVDSAPTTLDTLTPATARPPVILPTFAELLARGQIGRGQQLVLGLDVTSGEPMRGTFKSLYSVGLGGIQGSGKTWTAVSLLAQSAAQGARLIICDPHAGDEESLAVRCLGLASAFLCDVADDDRAILAALNLAHDELVARGNGAPQRWPLIVAVDEWLKLRRGALSAVLPELVDAFSTEGRKLNVHALLLSQRWPMDAVGEFRNSLASAYVHRLRPAEARMLTGLTSASLPNDTLQLPPGWAYLLDTSGAIHKVATPLMTPADVAAIGQMLNQPTSTPPAAPAMGFRPPPAQPSTVPSAQPAGDTGKTSGRPGEDTGKTAAQIPSSASQSQPRDPETARILALFLAGHTTREIVKEVYGVTGGRSYNDLVAKVEAIIRAELQAKGY